MEFRIAKQEFLRGLRLAQGIADRKSTMPMLANVLLRTQGKNQLLVAATDLNVSLTAELKSTNASDGGLTLGPRTCASSSPMCRVTTSPPRRPITTGLRSSEPLAIREVAVEHLRRCVPHRLDAEQPRSDPDLKTNKQTIKSSPGAVCRRQGCEPSTLVRSDPGLLARNDPLT